ncbi:MAG: DUF288 domain-containing protein [Planctomycetia bacterium]
MGSCIVITSINPPTAAVAAFARRSPGDVLVVGDAKTPGDWHCPGAVFVGLPEQESLAFRIVELLPCNHYTRKMVGYLLAATRDIDVIVDTDDDNIPKAEWAFPRFEIACDVVTGPAGYVNVYRLFTSGRIWPRGLPLRLIDDRRPVEIGRSTQTSRVGVWQGLADGDPDVDALYRLTHREPVSFAARAPVALAEGVVSPFNSQNTAWRRELFPLLYLPACVSFRFTDILRGLVAQPIMWSEGYRLGFTGATVDQKRNAHDLRQDFAEEIPMYVHGEKVVAVVKRAIADCPDIPSKLFEAYRGLVAAEIVPRQELAILSAWLHDLDAIRVERRPG